MKRLLIAAIIMLLWASPAMAIIDTESVGLFALRLIDFKQTLDIVDSGFYIPDSEYMKRHPSSDKIFSETMFISTIIDINSSFFIINYFKYCKS